MSTYHYPVLTVTSADNAELAAELAVDALMEQYPAAAASFPVQPLYSICRSAVDFTTLEFSPPLESDELWEALKLTYPHLSTHQQRKEAAVTDYFLRESAELHNAIESMMSTSDTGSRNMTRNESEPALGQWDPSSMALDGPSAYNSSIMAGTSSSEGTPFMSASNMTTGSGSPDDTSFDLPWTPDPHSLSRSNSGQQGPKQPTVSIPGSSQRKRPAAPETASLESLTSVLDMSMSPTKVKKRRAITQRERHEINEKRKLGTVCEECKRKKKKCEHALSRAGAGDDIARRSRARSRSKGSGRPAQYRIETPDTSPASDGSCHDQSSNSDNQLIPYVYGSALAGEDELSHDVLAQYINLDWDPMLDTPVDFPQHPLTKHSSSLSPASRLHASPGAMETWTNNGTQVGGTSATELPQQDPSPPLSMAITAPEGRAHHSPHMQNASTVCAQCQYHPFRRNDIFRAHLAERHGQVRATGTGEISGAPNIQLVDYSHWNMFKETASSRRPVPAGSDALRQIEHYEGDKYDHIPRPRVEHVTQISMQPQLISTGSLMQRYEPNDVAANRLLRLKQFHEDTGPLPPLAPPGLSTAQSRSHFIYHRLMTDRPEAAFAPLVRTMSPIQGSSVSRPVQTWAMAGTSTSVELSRVAIEGSAMALKMLLSPNLRKTRSSLNSISEVWLSGRPKQTLLSLAFDGCRSRGLPTLLGLEKLAPAEKDGLIAPSALVVEQEQKNALRRSDARSHAEAFSLHTMSPWKSTMALCSAQADGHAWSSTERTLKLHCSSTQHNTGHPALVDARIRDVPHDHDLQAVMLHSFILHLHGSVLAQLFDTVLAGYGPGQLPGGYHLDQPGALRGTTVTLQAKA